MKINITSLSNLIVFSYFFTSPLPANEIQVLHWWTSGSEKNAVEVFKAATLENGITWDDLAISGLAGESAINTLQILTMTGNPPDAAQIKGPYIQKLAKTGLLLPLSDIANQQNWSDHLPTELIDYFQYNGEYVATPINIHRVNAMWANPTIFRQLRLAYPRTWADFFTIVDTIKRAGYIPLALGEEPWQIATLFESIALATMGADLFRSAFAEKDSDALTHHSLTQSLNILKAVKPYTDSVNKGRNWIQSSNLVIEKKAAMQIMGDWTKGEFVTEGWKEGTDYVCLTAPGNENIFSFNIDSLVFFNKENTAKMSAQKTLASLILTPKLQEAFNQQKGSLPISDTTSLKHFDTCSQISMAAFKQALKQNTLTPSLSHNMALGHASQFAVFDVIANFYHNDNAQVTDTLKHLRAAVLADNL